VGRDAKRSDLARAEDHGLKVIHRIRRLHPGDPRAEALHRRQIVAMARIIRHATVLRERERGEDSGG
jgi:hypothetical protein